MKLPQYDNRPGPGEPLYKSDDSGWEDIKFPFMVVALLAALVGALFMTFQGLLDFLRSIFH
jgi:hypothetical protein